MELREITGCYSHERTPRRFGVEVELEGFEWNRRELLMKLEENYPNLRFKQDGSLRNGGLEIVTEPLAMAQAMEALGHMYDIRRKLGLIASPRCGMHVHVDFTRYYPREVGALGALYSVIEPALFALAGGPAREESIFCVPWYRTRDQMRPIVAWWTTQDWRTGLRYDMCKYTALNLRPLTNLGTVEFRHATTFQDLRDAKRWLQAVGRVVNAAQEREPEQMLDWLISNSPATITQRVLGDLWPAVAGINMTSLTTKYDLTGLLVELTPPVIDQWIMPNVPRYDGQARPQPDEDGITWANIDEPEQHYIPEFEQELRIEPEDRDRLTITPAMQRYMDNQNTAVPTYEMARQAAYQALEERRRERTRAARARATRRR